MRAMTSSLRYLKSSSRVLTARNQNQVSHFSSSSFSLPLWNRSKDLLCFHNNHQKHYFSSKPNMILERVFTNDWSQVGSMSAMKEKGFYLDEETHVTISRSLKGEKLKSDVVALSHFYKGMLEQNAMQNVVKKVLLEFFLEWSQLKSFGVFLRRRRVSVMNWRISRQLQKNKMMEDVVKLYEHMMDSSYKPSVLDCIMLLKSTSASDKLDLDLVFRVAKKFELAGYTLSKAVYDGIHRSLTSARKFDEAEKIVETMKNAGYESDNITYSQLIFGLCKTGRFEEALKVIDDMQANNIWVDIKTWTILIQWYCDACKLDDALLNLYKMIETNDADAELLEVLVDGFLKQKRVDAAYKLLLEISAKCRTCPRQATFKKLIDSLLGVRKFEEALDLLRLMKSKQYPPYHEPFVSHISKFGTMEDAAEFLRVLSLKNYPSHTVYLQIF
ncbi:putative tetratricopeptide-like helical domain-containing protein [Medicago truncatula]|uniref:Putative tetratricopeptide-like helical domain-containing protein n=1 Tax=Medicago truncatula TaxID=3880 RepID=A0A396JCX6_MEDTR|nr:putative tetratricopeptide-like helical domain-containing protein [Medicago truncatula]